MRWNKTAPFHSFPSIGKATGVSLRRASTVMPPVRAALCGWLELPVLARRQPEQRADLIVVEVFLHQEGLREELQLVLLLAQDPLATPPGTPSTIFLISVSMARAVSSE